MLTKDKEGGFLYGNKRTITTIGKIIMGPNGPRLAVKN